MPEYDYAKLVANLQSHKRRCAVESQVLACREAALSEALDMAPDMVTHVPHSRLKVIHDDSWFD